MTLQATDIAEKFSALHELWRPPADYEDIGKGEPDV